MPGQNKPFTIPRGEYLRSTIGWEPTCTCGGDPVPCVVLDPFGGSGTVAKVARDLGRSSILIEINPEYVQIAKKRLRIGEQLDSGVCEYVVKNFRPEATS
ncbi:MAG: DNA methyltransferase [Candidatus Caldatribacteriota bacterium]